VSCLWGEITGKEVADAVRGLIAKGDPAKPFAGISTDSRSIGPGYLFWAIPGERFDGHDFVEKVSESGAAGAVIIKEKVDHLFPTHGMTLIAVEDTLKALGDFANLWRTENSAKVAAVTGSAGKTTTKEMLHGILSLKGRALKTMGNLNNLIGLPLTILGMSPEDNFAVLEMGMNRVGEIARLMEIADPDVGVITNVGMAHLEGLGDINGVARAKTEMVAGIRKSATVVLNGDDELLMKTASPYGRNILTFGLKASNRIRASRIRESHEGTTFTMFFDKAEEDVTLSVHGLHNIKNALAAAGAATLLGASSAEIVRGLRLFTSLKGRFSPIALPDGALMIDDTYNANPLSLKAALDTLSSFASGEERSIVVGLGDMRELGGAAVSAHREAGRMVAAIGAVRFFVVGEFALDMAQGAAEGGMAPEAIVVCDSAEDMAEKLKRHISGREIILLKASRKVGLDRVAFWLTEKAVQEGR